MLRKLEVRDITSPEALRDSFRTFVVGTGFFLAVIAIIVLIRTNSKVEFGQVAEFSIFCVVPIVNIAILSALVFGFLQVLRAGTKLESVVVLCCSALGGMLPFVAVGMGPFLNQAVQLAIDHGDPSLPYLKAAIYQVLFEEEQAWPVKAIGYVGVSMSLLAIGLYAYWMVVLLSKVSKRGGRARTALATVCAWLLDGLLVAKVLGWVFWGLIIHQVIGHHG